MAAVMGIKILAPVGQTLANTIPGNPLQDVQADILEIEAGMDKISRNISKFPAGGNAEEVYREIQADRESDNKSEVRERWVCCGPHILSHRFEIPISLYSKFKEFEYGDIYSCEQLEAEAKKLNIVPRAMQTFQAARAAILRYNEKVTPRPDCHLGWHKSHSTETVISGGRLRIDTYYTYDYWNDDCRRRQS